MIPECRGKQPNGSAWIVGHSEKLRSRFWWRMEENATDTTEAMEALLNFLEAVSCKLTDLQVERLFGPSYGTPQARRQVQLTRFRRGMVSDNAGYRASLQFPSTRIGPV
jgi:hypothetical protein